MITTAGTTEALYRPDPIEASTDIRDIDRKSDWNKSAPALAAGERLLVTDLYSTGLNTLQALRRHLLAQHTDEPDYSHSRAFRTIYREASQNLLAPVAAHRLALDKAPEIGWFPELYGDVTDFLLPFPQIQGLNSAWQWYQKGIEIPPLNRRLHPFYGTYFPTRFPHLELLDTWLKVYGGPRQLALDVGTGCGVLALQMLQSGFDRVQATDNNPNAIESVRREISRKAPRGQLETAVMDLFGPDEDPDPPDSDQPELILFNPPWILGTPHSPIDAAIYYEAPLFERFFAGAHRRVQPAGHVVVLFSNLQEAADPSIEHPVQHELAEGGRFTLVSRQRQAVHASSDKTTRRKRDTSSEYVELWNLTPVTA